MLFPALALLLTFVHPVRPAQAAAACTTDLNCSLNGVCTAGACECDAPWTGPVCGLLGYKSTPASGRSLYPETDPHNTWNGAIIRGPDGVYHLYNPRYRPGSLGGKANGPTTMLHGTATSITGPYTWGLYPDIPTDFVGEFDGPKSVVYPDPATNRTMYSLWLGGGVYLAGDAAGPWQKLEGFRYVGSNPAPVWHGGAFFMTFQQTLSVYTTPRLVAGAKWSQYGAIDHTGVPADWIPEDPDMWIDKRGNWHVVGHAYDVHEYKSCATSILSTHFFSADGKTWHFLPGARAVQPYSHTVRYDDGTSHMFVTIERPNVFLDEKGRLTHIHLAADLSGGDAGCGDRKNFSSFGHCPCVNCKYGDHGGTTIIALDV